AGALVPVALPGTTVPSGTLVRDAKIAGVAAQGMLCSADELLICDERVRAILLLDRGEPGRPLTDVLPSEAILEAEINSNRRDCSAGVRPINNLVDITNYVLLEYAQPLHAFDLRKLHGPAIRVRRAVAGERILCLDGVQRELTTEMLVIADQDRAVAIAGV